MLVPARPANRARPAVEELGPRDLPALLLTVIIEPNAVLAILSDVRPASENANNHAHGHNPHLQTREADNTTPPDRATPPATSQPAAPAPTFTGLASTLTTPAAPATTTDAATPAEPTAATGMPTAPGTPPVVVTTPSILGLGMINPLAPVNAPPDAAQPTPMTPPASVNSELIQSAGPSPAEFVRPGEVQLRPLTDLLADRPAALPVITPSDAYHSAGRGTRLEEEAAPAAPAEDTATGPMDLLEMAPEDAALLTPLDNSTEGAALFEEPTTLYAGLAWGRDIGLAAPLALGLMLARVDRGRKRKDGKDESER